MRAALIRGMRAVLIRGGKGSADDLYIGETEKPRPKAGEVIVKVRLSTNMAVFLNLCPDAPVLDCMYRLWRSV